MTMLDLIPGFDKNRLCNPVSRRQFLRIGAIGSIGLPLILKQKALAEKNGRSGKNRAKSVMVIFLGGGLSHHDSFDMKEEATPEIRGKYRSIETVVPGLRISERLPLMARVMDRVTLVRSGAHNNDHHETATNWVLSGRFGSAFGDFPAMGAVVAHETGFRSTLPPYVAIPQNPSFTWELGKSAYLGGRYESFRTGDPNARDFRVEDVSPSEVISGKRMERRANLLQAVDGLAKGVAGSDQISTFDEFHQRAANMIFSSEARSAFSMDQESDRLRDRYGRTTFGQSVLLGRRLIERGVTYVTINYGGWDHHGKIFEGLDRKLPEFDQGLSALIQDMDDRGLLADTLVAVFGEFGRTPKLNKDAGRDHWGQAASLLFFGAGVRRGQVLGATDRQGAFVTRRPVSPEDVARTIYESVGVDPQKLLRAPDGRPIPVLDRGETVRELFA